MKIGAEKTRHFANFEIRRKTLHHGMPRGIRSTAATTYIDAAERRHWGDVAQIDTGTYRQQ